MSMAAGFVAETPKIKFGEKLGFLTFSGGHNIIFQFRNIYYLFFLTNVLHVPMGWAGLIVGIGTLWDAVTDPLLGYWAVNRKFKNGEFLRPYVLWYAAPWAVVLVMLFSDFGLSPQLAFAVSLFFFLLYEAVNTMSSLPYNGLAGLATNRESDRRSLNVYRNVGAMVGSAIGSVAILPLIGLFGGLDEAGNLIEGGGASWPFFIVACMMGALTIIGCLIHYGTTKERVTQVSSESSRISVKQIFRMVTHCRSWWYNMVIILCYSVTNFLLMASVVYYATYVIGSTAAATTLQAAYLVAAVLASAIVTPIDRRLGRRKTIMLAAAIGVAGRIWFILNPTTLGAMYVNAVAVGISVTFCFVLFNTNRNNIVEIIEAKDNRRIDSMIATTDNLAVKLSVAGAMTLSTAMLERSGFDANLAVQPEATINIIFGMLGWVPAIAGTLMLIAAFFLPIEKEYADAKEVLRIKAEGDQIEDS